MDKLIRPLLLFSFLTLLSLGFSQGLSGQKKLLTEGENLKIEDDVFGGSYEYVSSGDIVSDRVISGAANVSYKAINSIKLTTGFKVDKNCHFKARLIKYNEVTAKSAENENATLYSFSVYPSVSNGIVHIGLDNSGRQSSLNIYNSSGMLVHSTKQLKDGTTEIDLSGFPKGVYFLKAEVGDDHYLEKIVIQ